MAFIVQHSAICPKLRSSKFVCCDEKRGDQSKEIANAGAAHLQRVNLARDYVPGRLCGQFRA
jgi:hypothetical protein